ncbi:amino acid ABC transporter permease [Sphingobium sp. LMA1-1-1.1]|uniref:amino acid ABC transporter permease n=1 Tax=unclassified Sphingobium TaxID=2611147 RepID=UPI003449A908
MAEFLSDAVLYLPVLLKGLAMTIVLSLCALSFSVALGLLLALGGMSRLAALRAPARIFVNIIRGIPIIVQLFCVYFVLPEVGIELEPFSAGVVGLGIAYSVYQAENFRSGFQSVDPQTIEAARSLGMTDRNVFHRVTLPLGVRTALPPFGNTAVMLLKDSSIASTITIAELTRAGQLLAISTFKNGTIYLLVALLYLAASLPLAAAVRHLERRMGRR